MPDWKSTAEIQVDADFFSKFIHALLGLYAYEWFISLDFDWDFISGKKHFRWPMTFYFANRYILLISLIGVAIALDTHTQINCQALYTFNLLAGDAAVGLASINLSIRTMAVWAQNKYIIIFLVIVILGHWSLILQGVQITAVWVPGTGCVITKTNNKIFTAIFIYSMCFDLTVLLLNGYKLLGINSNITAGEMMSRSRLAKMIFSDGLIYFIIAFLANLVATVFMLLNLNPVMSLIFNAPAAVLSTIVACRVVRRLTNFRYNSPPVSGANSSSHHRAMAGNNMRGVATYQPGGVHVQMESFTHAGKLEDNQGDPFPMPKEREGTRSEWH